jgi:hypothetical protein
VNSFSPEREVCEVVCARSRTAKNASAITIHKEQILHRPIVLKWLRGWVTHPIPFSILLKNQGQRICPIFLIPCRMRGDAETSALCSSGISCGSAE